MMHDWDTLRLMRSQGAKPAAAVIVTTRHEIPQRLRGVDALVILHKPGEPMPVKLLEGLDVILMLDRCDRAVKVSKLCEKHHVTPASLRAFCHCMGITTLYPPCCESHSQLAEAWGW